MLGNGSGAFERLPTRNTMGLKAQLDVLLWSLNINMALTPRSITMIAGIKVATLKVSTRYLICGYDKSLLIASNVDIDD